jgi:D-beta-D-heptose 7-phosphate kinase/D-beta-D-heptose 1-phosphate adenosyltransferase
VPVVIAPKDSDPVKYLGATVLIPNLGELEQLSGTRIDGPESLTQMAEGIIAHLGVQALLVTRGREGMSLFECVSDSLKQVDIPTAALAVYDVTGAGDTVASVFTAAVGAGAGYEVAARIANIAAGIVVGKLGTAAVTPAEILDYVSKRSDDSIRAGRKVVRVS